MQHAVTRRYRFNPYDRITLNGAHYRPVSKVGVTHVLQLVSGNVLEPHEVQITDLEISERERRKNYRCEENYYSRAYALLRARQDDSQLFDLSEEELRTIDWKVEWCKRYGEARANPNYAIKVTLNKAALGEFIELERDHVDRWYTRKYGERRQVGRPVVPKVPTSRDASDVKVRKEYDYPSPSALKTWVALYRSAGFRREAFRPRYQNSGRRGQLHPLASNILDQNLSKYLTTARKTTVDVFEFIESALLDANRKRSGEPKITISRSTVYRRIKRLNPFETAAARFGEAKTTRSYAMVSCGNGTLAPLERVEIDDWEADLFTLAEKSSVWKRLTKKERSVVPRIRCTITVAIDCTTRCILGLNVSPIAPTTAAAKATVQSILSDKSGLANFGGASHGWPMMGRPETIATDGGSVFRNDEMDYTLANCGIQRLLPENDPRKRGTIESFFRTLKRLCRYFSGQAFENVVKRGDYPAEQMASLCFEQFHKAVVRFIVDSYHLRKHRGLGLSPSAEWDRLVNSQDYDAAPIPSSAQQLVAFGFPAHDVTLDKHGILNNGISYTSPELGKLMQLTGIGAKMLIVTQPYDLGSILVYVEARYRKEMFQAAGQHMLDEFLEVETPIKDFHGVSLASLAIAKSKAFDYAALKMSDTEEIRIDTNRHLYEMGEEALKVAGIRDGMMNAATAEAIRRRTNFLSQADPYSKNNARESVSVNEDYGDLVTEARMTIADRDKEQSNTSQRVVRPARSGQTRPAPIKPFSRSANLEEDEE